MLSIHLSSVKRADVIYGVAAAAAAAGRHSDVTVLSAVASGQRSRLNVQTMLNVFVCLSL